MALTFNIVSNVLADRLLIGIIHIDNLKQKAIRILTSIETLCSFAILNKYQIKLIAVDAPLEHCSSYK